MKVRALHHNDYDKLKVLMLSYKKSVGEPEFSDHQFEDLVNAIESGHIEFFVVEKEGSLIAMCSIARFYSTFNFTKSAIFEDFFVKKDYRGKGIARKLINHVFDTCSEKGVDSVLVGSAEVDQDMYRSLGFSNALGKLFACTLGED